MSGAQTPVDGPSRGVDPALLAEPGRLADLHDSGLLDGDGKESFDRLTRLAEQLLDVPMAMVNLVDRDRQVFASTRGASGPFIDAGEMPLPYSFCQYVVESGSQLVATELRAHPLLAGNPSIEEFGTEAYVGSPLTTEHGTVLGTLCVFDTEPREWLEWELEVVADLAAVAVAEIDFRIRAARLREVGARIAGLQRPMGELAEVVRSLANVADRAGDARVERLASAARTRLHAVEAAAVDLSGAAAAAGPDATGTRRGSVSVADRLLRAARMASLSVPDADLRVAVLHRPLTVEADAHELERALARLLVDAMRHAGDDPVAVTADRGEDTATLEFELAQALPVTELTRLVADAAALLDPDADPANGSVATAGGRTSVQVGDATGSTGPDGTRLRVELPLHSGPSFATDAV